MEQNFDNQDSIFRPEAKHSPVGPVVGAIIIVAILAFGALYFWGDRLNSNAGVTPYTLDDEQEAALANEKWMPESTGSDAAADIAAELEAFDVDALEGHVESDFETASAEI